MYIWLSTRPNSSYLVSNTVTSGILYTRSFVGPTLFPGYVNDINSAIFMFKVYHTIYPNIITSLFCKVSLVSHYFKRRNVLYFFVKQCNYLSTRHFILHSVIFIWNNLPASIKNIVILRRFKSAVRSHLFVMHNDEFV